MLSVGYQIEFSFDVYFFFRGGLYYIHVQSVKILLVPQKCEIIFGTLSVITMLIIPILDFSLSLPQLVCFNLCNWFCSLVHGFFSVLLPL